MARLLLAIFLAAFATQGWAEGLFGTLEIRADRIDSFPKWVEVLARIRQQNRTLSACRQAVAACPGSGTQRWRSMMRQAAGAGRTAQLGLVNHFFNQWPYIEDSALYGKSDYWATPLEFMSHSGDCEDYAIAKFVTLRLLGWPNAELRLVIVRDRVRDVPHAVLAVRQGGGEMILDNLASRPLPSALVLQYSPYYAVNETTRWVFLKPR
jgi:predicted transglutaminase-like cysteine proteinase